MAKAKMRYVKPETYGMEAPISSEKRKYYPTINFNMDQLPEAKSWKVGQEHEVKMVLRMTSISDHENSKGNAGFEVREIACCDDKEEED